VLTDNRPKILIPGALIYNRDDMTREVLFLQSGEVDVSPGIGTRVCYMTMVSSLGINEVDGQPCSRT
jgi:hypothetical protein